MKLVTVRQKITVPIALARELPVVPSDSDWNTFIEALLEWTGFKRKVISRNRQDEVVFWMKVAAALALRTLPCFKEFRMKHRRSGGRPRLDRPPLFNNPHAELVSLVQQEVDRLKSKGEKASVTSVCKRLRSRALPSRYQGVTARRLERLYYDGVKIDRTVANLKKALLRYKPT